MSATAGSWSESRAPYAPGNPVRTYVWELPVRVSHWFIFLSVVVLSFTGYYMHNPFIITRSRTAYLMGTMRFIHLLAASVFICAFLLRVYWFFVGNNYARSGFPMFWRFSWYKAVFQQVLDYLHLERGHIHIGHNSLAGASYAAFFAMCGFEGVTGMALYSESNPGGFWDHVAGWTIPLLGGSFRVHMWHHLVAWLIVVFVLFHIYIVLYDTQLYKNGLVDSIIAGPKFYEPGDHDADKWIS